MTLILPVPNFGAALGRWFVAVCVVWLATARCASGKEFVDLIDPELRAWKTTGKWSVGDDGVVTLTPKSRGFRLFPDYKSFLWATKPYENFELHLEFRLSPGARSGVFLRASSLSDYLEVQIADSAGSSVLTDADCGGLVDYAAPTANRVKPAGQWNEMRIRIVGDQLSVWLNGGDVLAFDLNAHQGTRGLGQGRLALQAQSHVVSFRKVRIRELDRP